MAEDNGVKPAAPAGVLNPSDEGKIPYEKLQEMYAKEKKESERMKGALESLQGERDEIQSRVEELEGIEERRELTAREEAEKRRLQTGGNDLDSQINELKRNPANEVFFKYMDREINSRLERAARIAEENGKVGALTELATDFIEDAAEQLASKDDFKGMTTKKLLGELRPFLSMFDEKNRYRRVQLAFKEWQKHQELASKRDSITKREAELNASLENGGRLSRNTTVEDDLKVGDRASAREKLGIMHRQK